jgi:hypothetical protein
MTGIIRTKSFLMLLICLFCFILNLCQTVSTAAEDPNTTIKNEPNDSAKSESISQTEKTSNYNLALRKHSLEIGPEVYSFTYKEPGGIKDEGIFYGGVLNYTFRGWVPNSPDISLPESGVMFRTEFRYAAGNADYDGFITDGATSDPYKMNGIEYNTHETRLLLGIDTLGQDWIATLSTGVGYRYSTDDSSFDPYGYRRESNYIYVPIAYQLDSAFENNWSWGGKFEIDLLTWGKQKSYLSDVGDVDIENYQKTGYGLRGSIRFRNKTNMGIFTIEPFIRYWSIDISDYVYVDPYRYWEPENTTTEIGMQVLWKF